MGSSQTYHCVGHIPIGERRFAVVGAMNALEIMQEEAKAKKHGERVVQWWAQTQTGRRILGGDTKKGGEVKKARGAIKCTFCGGRGCQACNFSGITTRQHLSGYRPWQVERFKREAGLL
ncbi:MAG: hypothetical protein ABIH23_20175 [bacterium]